MSYDGEYGPLVDIHNAQLGGCFPQAYIEDVLFICLDLLRETIKSEILSVEYTYIPRSTLRHPVSFIALRSPGSGRKFLPLNQVKRLISSREITIPSARQSFHAHKAERSFRFFPPEFTLSSMQTKHTRQLLLYQIVHI